MATAKIWHYAGHVGDEQNSKTQLAKEPYLSRQQVTTSATAAASTAAPYGANLVRIEVTVATRFRVRLSSDSTAADANEPPLFVGTQVDNWFNLPTGATLSLIEAA
jgi:hypothetical protein